MTLKKKVQVLQCAVSRYMKGLLEYWHLSTTIQRRLNPGKGSFTAILQSQTQPKGVKPTTYVTMLQNNLL